MTVGFYTMTLLHRDKVFLYTLVKILRFYLDVNLFYISEIAEKHRAVRNKEDDRVQPSKDHDCEYD